MTLDVEREMNRILIVCMLTLLVLGCQTGPRTAGGVIATEPDTSLAKPLGRWPNDEDLARLESTKGKTKAEVLAILGHPKKVSFNPEGVEMWDYPWLAVCRIWLKNGIVSNTYYDAGY
jgi:outer membrane protein assembly factor BamE (lipoprotein component of BamABCDE complex)